MGSFDNETKMLKKYARRGQCFSTTNLVGTLKQTKIKLNYPDIERNGYCFTDGCGYINPLLAIMAANKYNMTNVSAIQIRIGGAKGVCMVKPKLLIETDNKFSFKKKLGH